MDIVKRMDVLNAIACLKAMCASETCVNCPAYMGGSCKIKNTNPEDYDLNIGDDVWRAFK